MSHVTPSDYPEEQIQRMLAEDPGIAEQGIIATVRGDTLVLCGEVESPQRREHIEQLVTEHFPGVRIRCDIAVTRAGAPEEAEELQ